MIIRSLLALLIVQFVQCKFFPLDEEIIYDYLTIVQTSASPDNTTSAYEVHAKLVVSAMPNNSAYLYLKDVMYATYSGKRSLVSNLNVPNEAKPITLPFEVVYNEHGLAIGLKTSKDDKAWSINIKKAIASIFQVDFTVLNAESVKVNESSVYGHCGTSYTINEYQKHIIVNKTLSPNKCGDFKWNSDATVFDSDPSYDHRPIISVTRKYILENHQNYYIFDTIDSHNVVEYTAVGYKGAPLTTSVKQYFKKMDTQLAGQRKWNTDDWVLQNLKTTFTQVDQDGAIKEDINGGRSVVDHGNMLRRAKREVDLMVTNFRSKVLNLNRSVKLKDETVYRVLQALNLLDLNGLSDLFYYYNKNDEDVDQERLQLFLSLLPYIGSRDSAIFIRDSVLNNTINTEAIEKILVTFPPYYRNPDLFIVEQMYKMMNASLEREVKVSIILSVASILGRAVAQYPSNERLKQIEDGFIDEFISITDPSMKIVYVSALSNMRSKRVYFFLEGLITGENKEVKISTNTRGLIMWLVKQEHTKYPELMQRIYWPILLNNKEDITIRTAAYKILMTFPTLDDLLKVKALYYGDAPPSLQILIKTYIKSIMNSKSTFYTRTRKLMEEAFGSEFSKIDELDGEINYMHDYVYDYMDPNLGFGVELKGSVMGNLLKDEYLQMYFQISPQFDNNVINSDGMLFQTRIDDDEVRSKILLTFKYLKRQYIRQVWTVISGINVTQEIFLFRNNRVVGVYSDFNVALTKLYGSWPSSDYGAKNTTRMEYRTEFMINADIVVPTDFGVPIQSFVQIPTINRIHQHQSSSETIYMILSWSQLRTTQLFVCSKVYNPFVDLWVGSKRIQSTFMNLPLNFTLSMGMKQLDIYNTENNVRKSYGFRSLASSYVFVEDDKAMSSKEAKDKLQLTCEGCQSETLIPIENKDPEGTKTNFKIEKLGISLTSKFTGSDDCRSHTRMRHFLESLYISKNYNDHGFYLPTILMRLDYFWKYQVLYPMKGNCDSQFYINPIYDQNVINTSQSLKAGSGGVNCSHKMVNEGKTIKSWDFKLSYTGEELPSDINTTFVQFDEEVETKRYCTESNFKMFGYNLDFALKLTNGVGECLPYKEPYDLTVKGSIPEDLDPIKIKEDVYDKCIEQSLTYKCVQDLTSLRRYEVEITPGEDLQEFAENFWGSENNLTFHEPPINSFIERRQLKLQLDLGPTNDQMDIKVSYKNYEKNISKAYSSMWPFKSISSHVMPHAPIIYLLQFSGICRVFSTGVNNVYGTYVNGSYKDWTIVAKHFPWGGDSTWGIDVKAIDELKIAIRIKYKKNTLEVEKMENGSFRVTDNGVVLTMDNYKRYAKDWYLVTISKSMFIHFIDSRIDAIYTGTSLLLDIPREHVFEPIGDCYHPEEDF